MNDIGVSKLVTWAKQHEPDARYILAELAGSEDVPLTPLGGTLLITYPDDDSIAKRLIGTFLSGSWSGSMTSWLESKLEQAKELLSDSNATIRRWARELVKLIEEDIRTTSQREEEEDLRFSGG
jgi:hypothetical protein